MHATHLSPRRRSIAGLLIAALALTAAALPARADVADALNQAPAGAQLVLIVPNMAELSDKLAMINAEWGIDDEDLGNALASFKEEMGMNAGVDDQGAMLIVIEDLASAIENEQDPEFCMLVPVTDYNAFVGNYGGDGSAAMTPLTMPDSQGFAKSIQGYAVIAEEEAVLAAFEPGGAAEALMARMGGVGGDYFKNCDAALYIDLEAIGPAVMPKLEEELENAKAEMANQGQMDASMVEMTNSMMDLYSAGAKALFEGSEGMVITADLAQAGAGLSYALRMKADSTLASYFNDADANPGGALAALPSRPYIFAVASDAQSIDMGRMMQTVFDSVPEDGQGSFLSIYKDAIPLLEMTNSSAMAFFPPDPAAMMAGGFFNILTVYEVDDAQAFMDANRQYMDSLNGFSMDMGADMNGQPQTMSMTSSFTENVLQVDDVQVHQYSMNINFPPEMLQQMGPMGMMGMSGYNGYIAAKGNHVVTTATLDPQLVKNGLETIDAGDGLGASGPIDGVRDAAMPPNCSMEMYVSAVGLAELGTTFGAMFGVPPIQIDEDTPPLAMGFGTKDNDAAFRVYLPTLTVQRVKAVIEQLEQEMSQQQQGGGGGPAPYN